MKMPCMINSDDENDDSFDVEASEWSKVVDSVSKIGQSEGIEDGYKLTFQENFDSGYKCAFEMAFKIGVLKGLMKCQGTEDAKIDNCLLCEKEEKFKELSLEDTQKIHNKHEVDKTKILKNLAKPILEKSNIEKVDFLQ